MESKEWKPLRWRCANWFRQCLLVIETIGLEASVALEVIFMIANIQTLGVPIRYSSLPATIAAACGIVLIPTMGVIMDKCAKSKTGKAKILIITSCLQLLGNLLVFSANTVKLLYFDDIDASNDSAPWISFNSTQTSITNNTISLTPTPNTSLSPHSIREFTAIISTNTTSPSLREQFITSETFQPHILSNEFSHSDQVLSEDPIHYFAIMAMIGYSLLDCGYDSSNCFVKTFALASTPPNDYSSIIAKAVFVSSFGGCLIAILGSIGLGTLLTAGTSHDENAAQTACVSGLCFVLLLSGLITTLATGFCCPLQEDKPLDESTSSLTIESRHAESSPLISSNNMSRDLLPSQTMWGTSESNSNFLEKSLSGRFSGHAVTTQRKHRSGKKDVLDHVVLDSRTGLLGFVYRQKKQILINLFAFFMLSALYSYEVYAVNFVGDGIYKGDPLSPVGSEAYQNYLTGIEVGSQGTLIYYITFTICTSVHEPLLKLLGWKLEVLVAASVYVVVNLLCALTVSLWAFYLTAVWTGVYRTVVVTVPYILANKIVLEECSGKDSGMTIAIVAAMLPCGFSVCSAVMGPLIDATGNPATPLYYTAVTVILGIISILFLKA